MLLLPRLVGGSSGLLVEKLGYAQFFLVTALLGIPTLLLILLQWRRERGQANGAPPPAEASEHA
jgi:PAT family beta-lactamase induction signal transducer AmpG